MANLTGEYDVTVEVSVEAVNRILAVVHENEDSRYPVLPHCMKMVVDDTSRGEGDPVAESERTGVQAAVEMQLSTPAISLPQGPVIGGAISIARTGRLMGTWDIPTPSDVSIRVGVRAWVRDSPEPSLPRFIHGDVIVSANVVRTTFDPTVDLEPATEAFLLRRVGPIFGGTFIGLDRSRGLGVSFLPAPGTTISDEERVRIQQIIYNLLRSDFKPVTFEVSMPDAVRRWDYRLDPAHASLRLMIVLTNRSLGPGALGSLSGGWVSPGTDFAIAIGRDFLLPLLKSQLLQNMPSEFSFSKYRVRAKVRPNWAAAGFTLETGRIVLTVNGNGTISWWGIDDSFTFTIRLGFTLAVVNGGLELQAAGDPEVDLHDVAVGEGYIEGKARGRIRDERDHALAAARAQIRDALDVQRQLEEVIGRIIAAPADLTVTGAQIRPDGILVPGRIGVAPSRPVVVRHLRREGMIDAVDSWIPGGTIDRFVWSRDTPVFTPLIALPGVFGNSSQRIEEHRFVTEESTSPVAFELRCLDVYGRRVTSGGGIASVSGHTCGFYVPIPPWTAVAWPIKAGRATPVVPLRGVRPDGTHGTVGHFSLWGSGLAPSDGATTLVVYFAAENWEETIDAFASALKESRGAIVAVVLLPGGSLAKPSRKTIQTEAALVVSEDVDGHWAESLGVSKVPATVVIDRRGRVVFREEGPLSLSRLGAALTEYAEPGGRVSWQPLRLGVVSGDLPPEFPFRAGGGGAELSLRRMRGRRVVITFWAAWCEPSLEQLRELRRAHETACGRAPLVLAIGDGESADFVMRLAREEKLPFVMIPDPTSAISRRFVVGVWPSTVWVGPNMRVEAVNLGLTAVGEDGSRSHDIHVR
jgi:peroxiredoxin